jgi:hypothetical protein
VQVPAIDKTVSLKPFRSNVPVPLPKLTAEPSGITPDAPNFNVPAVIVVVPVYALPVLESINADVLLFCVTPVTLDPISALIVVEPVPVPVFVTVPTLFTLLVDNVIVPVVAPLLIVKLLVPVTPPLKVVDIAVPVLPKVKVPVVVEANTIALLYSRPVTLTKKEALLVPPPLSPSVTDPVPTETAVEEPAITAPALMIVPPVYVLLPDKVKLPEPCFVKATFAVPPSCTTPANDVFVVVPDVNVFVPVPAALFVM